MIHTCTTYNFNTFIYFKNNTWVYLKMGYTPPNVIRNMVTWWCWMHICIYVLSHPLSLSPWHICRLHLPQLSFSSSHVAAASRFMEHVAAWHKKINCCIQKTVWHSITAFPQTSKNSVKDVDKCLENVKICLKMSKAEMFLPCVIVRLGCAAAYASAFCPRDSSWQRVDLVHVRSTAEGLDFVQNLSWNTASNSRTWLTSESKLPASETVFNVSGSGKQPSEFLRHSSAKSATWRGATCACLLCLMCHVLRQLPGCLFFSWHQRLLVTLMYYIWM